MMLHVPDPYGILGVPRNAPPSDIQVTYQGLIDRLTPAHQSGNLAALRQIEQARDAYQLLTDRKRRHAFDLTLKEQGGPPTALGLRVTASRRTIEILDEPQVVYLLLQIEPDVIASHFPEPQPATLNVALVLDHSNSMQGARLDRVKLAATEIIEQLGENDFLSVVGFNDRPEIIIPATTVRNKRQLISRARMMRASGGTEIYKGLQAGYDEVLKNLDDNHVNHLILLTDGNTYGDQEECHKLAKEAAERGVGISVLGLGSEWNDDFLDEIAAMTGGTSMFIKSARDVGGFMNNQVKHLSNLFAERIQLSLASAEHVALEMVFKLTPSPQSLPEDEPVIALGGMQAERPISVLAQFLLPANLQPGFYPLVRSVITGDVLATNRKHATVSEFSIEVVKQASTEAPPTIIIDALGKLALYRLQERASESVKAGDIKKATRQLENLATRLIDMGEPELAQEAQQEAVRLSQTKMLSEESRKNIKYSTRHLLSSEAEGLL